ncbi:MAG: RdgB/HAM1 family non-canonical purine NTP pyrophosphatase [Burkholderiales bacterium]|nr:RdgB/HAM1 family non-canonical purine NTP pyrophosphatase [Phycisphaerae bacterium]
MTILVATRNTGKAAEFAEMLASSGIDWCDLSAFPHAPEVDETGITFRANACLKASQYARATGSWTIADDSGLEVDFLHAAPGVLSARWASTHNAGAGDVDNNRLLLQQLSDAPDDRRSARFVCVLALSDPLGQIVLTARDTMEGKIIREACGANGFGYDPLFMITERGRTTAELSPADKHAISHRGKALVRIRQMMQGLLTVMATNKSDRTE